MEHGKVDSKNNHYVHSHWRAGLGRQSQVRLWSVFRKSGCSLSSSSQDSTPLITSKPGKLKPDSISKSWHLLMRMKKGAKIGFLLPGRKALPWPALLTLLHKQTGPQPNTTEDFVSDSPVTGTAEISTFATSWQNFPCVSKTPGKGFAHRLQARGGEDLAQTVEGNAASSAYCQQEDTGSTFHRTATPTEIEECQEKNQCSLNSHLQFLLHFQTKQIFFFLKTVFQTRIHCIEQIIAFQARLEEGAT